MALILNTSTLADAIKLAPLEDTVYVFIEDENLTIPDIYALDERFEPDEGMEILKQMAIDNQISVYMPGGMPEEHRDFPTLTKGFIPWNDTDEIQYFYSEKKTIILKKI